MDNFDLKKYLVENKLNEESISPDKKIELNDAVKSMFRFIKDYKTGEGGVTDEFIKKELHFFGREYLEILSGK